MQLVGAWYAGVVKTRRKNGHRRCVEANTALLGLLRFLLYRPTSSATATSHNLAPYIVISVAGRGCSMFFNLAQFTSIRVNVLVHQRAVQALPRLICGVFIRLDLARLLGASTYCFIVSVSQRPRVNSQRMFDRMSALNNVGESEAADRATW